MIGAAVRNANPPALGHGHGRHVARRIAIPAIALLLQTTGAMVFPAATLLNLPLLATVYVALGARTPAGATVAGMLIGWAHDGLTHGPLGVFGMAYSVLGYLAGMARQLLEMGEPAMLGTFVGFAYALHEVLLFAIRRYLMDQPVAPEPVLWIALAALHVGLALVVFPILNRVAARR